MKASLWSFFFLALERILTICNIMKSRHMLIYAFCARESVNPLVTYWFGAGNLKDLDSLSLMNCSWVTGYVKNELWACTGLSVAMSKSKLFPLIHFGYLLGITSLLMYIPGISRFGIIALGLWVFCRSSTCDETEFPNSLNVFFLALFY